MSPSPLRVGAGGIFPADDAFVPPVTGLPANETWSVPDVVGSLNGDHGWVDFIGSHGWSVLGGAAQLQGSGAAAQGGRMVVDLGADDYLAQVTVTEFFHTGVGLVSAGPCARFQNSSVFTCYALALGALNGVGFLSLFRFVAGAQTTLATAAITPASGQTVGLRVKGGTQIGYVNGVPRLSAADGAIPTGRFLGLQGIANTGQRVRLDTMMGRALWKPLTSQLLTFQPMTGVA